MLSDEMRARLGERFAHLKTTEDIRAEGENIRGSVGGPEWNNKPHRLLYDAIALANRACDLHADSERARRVGEAVLRIVDVRDADDLLKHALMAKMQGHALVADVSRAIAAALREEAK